MPADHHDIAEIQTLIAPLLPAMFGGARLVAASEIPRTVNGKVQRKALNETPRRHAQSE